jgi:hypothetical protein
MVRADIGENKKGSIIANWLCLIGMGTMETSIAGRLYCLMKRNIYEKNFMFGFGDEHGQRGICRGVPNETTYCLRLAENQRQSVQY